MAGMPDSLVNGSSEDGGKTDWILGWKDDVEEYVVIDSDEKDSGGDGLGLEEELQSTRGSTSLGTDPIVHVKRGESSSELGRVQDRVSVESGHSGASDRYQVHISDTGNQLAIRKFRRVGSGSGSNSMEFGKKRLDARRFRRELSAPKSKTSAPDVGRMRGSMKSDSDSRDNVEKDFQEHKVNRGIGPQVHKNSPAKQEPVRFNPSRKESRDMRGEHSIKQRPKRHDGREAGGQSTKESERKRSYEEYAQAQLSAERKSSLRDRTELSKQSERRIRRQSGSQLSDSPPKSKRFKRDKEAVDPERRFLRGFEKDDEFSARASSAENQSSSLRSHLRRFTDKGKKIGLSDFPTSEKRTPPKRGLRADENVNVPEASVPLKRTSIRTPVKRVSEGNENSMPPKPQYSEKHGLVRRVSDRKIDFSPVETRFDGGGRWMKGSAEKESTYPVQDSKDSGGRTLAADFSRKPQSEKQSQGKERVDQLSQASSKDNDEEHEGEVEVGRLDKRLERRPATDTEKGKQKVDVTASNRQDETPDTADEAFSPGNAGGLEEDFEMKKTHYNYGSDVAQVALVEDEKTKKTAVETRADSTKGSFETTEEGNMGADACEDEKLRKEPSSVGLEEPQVSKGLQKAQGGFGEAKVPNPEKLNTKRKRSQLQQSVEIKVKIHQSNQSVGRASPDMGRQESTKEQPKLKTLKSVESRDADKFNSEETISLVDSRGKGKFNTGETTSLVDSSGKDKIYSGETMPLGSRFREAVWHPKTLISPSVKVGTLEVGSKQPCTNSESTAPLTTSDPAMKVSLPCKVHDKVQESLEEGEIEGSEGKDEVHMPTAGTTGTAVLTETVEREENARSPSMKDRGEEMFKSEACNTSGLSKGAPLAQPKMVVSSLTGNNNGFSCAEQKSPVTTDQLGHQKIPYATLPAGHQFQKPSDAEKSLRSGAEGERSLQISEEGSDSADGERERDNHNSYCEICRQGGELICCDGPGCKNTCHLECTDPKLSKIPDGNWYCPSCTQKGLVNAEFLGLVEFIWDVRDDAQNLSPKVVQTADEGGPSTVDRGRDDSKSIVGHENDPRGFSNPSPRRDPGPGQTERWRKLGESRSTVGRAVLGSPSSAVQTLTLPDRPGEKLYFVKWKGISHVHNTWVAESDLAKRSPKALARFKKKLEEGQRPKWNPEWVEPQRLIGKELHIPPVRPGGGRGRGFLGMGSGLQWYVKWKGLGYEHCTWEPNDSAVFATDSKGYELPAAFEKLAEGAAYRHHPQQVEEAKQMRCAAFNKKESQPDWIKDRQLCPYQLNMLNLLCQSWHHRENAIMVEKDVQEKLSAVVVLLLSLIKDYRVNRPMLLVVPAFDIETWEAEIQEYGLPVYTVVYNGGKDARAVIQRFELKRNVDPPKVQLVLATYDTASSDFEYLRTFMWEAVIVDENQQSKTSKLYRSSWQFGSAFRLILINDLSKCNVEDLQQMYFFVQPPNPSTNTDFQGQVVENEKAELIRLQNLLSSHVVINSKPEDSFSFGLELRECWLGAHMSPIQVHLYSYILTKHYNLLYSGRLHAEADSSSLHDLMAQLRLCCQHPYHVDSTLQENVKKDLALSPKGTGIAFVQAEIALSGKLQLVHAMLSVFHSQGRRVLILSQTLRQVVVLEDVVRLIYGEQSYETVDSKFPAAKKNAAVQKFNAKDSSRSVFLLRSGATGVSLKFRDTDALIIYDSDLNPANDLEYLRKVLYKVDGELKVYRLYNRLTVEEGSMIYGRRKNPEPDTKPVSTKFLQQLLRWKVQDVLALDTPSSVQAILMEGKDKGISPEVKASLARVKNLLQENCSMEECSDEILDDVWADEDGESMKKFWSLLLKDRYAEFQKREEKSRASGSRQRKKVLYSEDALALAPYSVVDEEGGKRKRKRPQLLEPVSVPRDKIENLRHTSSQSPASTPSQADSSHAEDSAQGNNMLWKAFLDVQSAEASEPEVVPSGGQIEEVVHKSVVLNHVQEPLIASSGAEKRLNEDPVIPRSGMTRARESVSHGPSHAVSENFRSKPASSGSVPPSGNVPVPTGSTKNVRIAQKKQLQIMQPEVSKICQILAVSEDIANYAQLLLSHVMNNFRMPEKPRELVVMIETALCLLAAARAGKAMDHSQAVFLLNVPLEVSVQLTHFQPTYERVEGICKGYEALPSVQEAPKRAETAQPEDPEGKNQHGETANSKVPAGVEKEAVPTAPANVATRVQNNSQQVRAASSQPHPPPLLTNEEVMAKLKACRDKFQGRLMAKQKMEAEEFSRNSVKESENRKTKFHMQKAALLRMNFDAAERTKMLQVIEDSFANQDKECKRELEKRRQEMSDRQKIERKDVSLWYSKHSNCATAETLPKIFGEADLMAKQFFVARNMALEKIPVLHSEKQQLSSPTVQQDTTSQPQPSGQLRLGLHSGPQSPSQPESQLRSQPLSQRQSQGLTSPPVSVGPVLVSSSQPQSQPKLISPPVPVDPQPQPGQLISPPIPVDPQPVSSSQPWQPVSPPVPVDAQPLSSFQLQSQQPITPPIPVDPQPVSLPHPQSRQLISSPVPVDPVSQCCPNPRPQIELQSPPTLQAETESPSLGESASHPHPQLQHQSQAGPESPSQCMSPRPPSVVESLFEQLQAMPELGQLPKVQAEHGSVSEIQANSHHFQQHAGSQSQLPPSSPTQSHFLPFPDSQFQLQPLNPLFGSESTSSQAVSVPQQTGSSNITSPHPVQSQHLQPSLSHRLHSQQISQAQGRLQSTPHFSPQMTTSSTHTIVENESVSTSRPAYQQGRMQPVSDQQTVQQVTSQQVRASQAVQPSTSLLPRISQLQTRIPSTTSGLPVRGSHAVQPLPAQQSRIAHMHRPQSASQSQALQHQGALSAQIQGHFQPPHQTGRQGLVMPNSGLSVGVSQARPNPSGQSASLLSGQGLLAQSQSDPLVHEINRLRKEREKVKQTYSTKLAELRVRCEREMQELRKRHDDLLQENFRWAEEKNTQLDDAIDRVDRNRRLAEALRLRSQLDSQKQRPSPVQPSTGNAMPSSGRVYGQLPQQSSVAATRGMNRNNFGSLPSFTENTTPSTTTIGGGQSSTSRAGLWQSFNPSALAAANWQGPNLTAFVSGSVSSAMVHSAPLFTQFPAESARTPAVGAGSRVPESSSSMHTDSLFHAHSALENLYRQQQLAHPPSLQDVALPLRTSTQQQRSWTNFSEQSSPSQPILPLFATQLVEQGLVQHRSTTSAPTSSWQTGAGPLISTVSSPVATEAVLVSASLRVSPVTNAGLTVNDFTVTNENSQMNLLSHSFSNQGNVASPMPMPMPMPMPTTQEGTPGDARAGSTIVINTEDRHVLTPSTSGVESIPPTPGVAEVIELSDDDE